MKIKTERGYQAMLKQREELIEKYNRNPAKYREQLRRVNQDIMEYEYRKQGALR